MPYKGPKSHPGQRAGSERKRRTRKANVEALQAEAKGLGVTPTELSSRKAAEWRETGAEIARRAAAAKAAATRAYEEERARWSSPRQGQWG